MAEVRKSAIIGEAAANRDSTMGKALADREATVTSSKAMEEAQLARLSADVAVAEAQKDKDLRLREFEAEVESAKADSDMAYDLQRAKRQQVLSEETLGVSIVEKKKQIEVENAEIERRERELVHSVLKPAQAEQERTMILAKAETDRRRLLAEADAAAAKAQGLAEADVIRAKGEAEAEAIRLRTLAEAEGLKAKYLAEAEGMQQKAKAYQEYNDAAVTQMLMDRLPEIAAAVASPLGRVDKITLVNSGGDGSVGVEKITRGVTEVLAQIPGVVETMSGINLPELVAKVAEGGKTQAKKTQPVT
ncbi:MAG: hypothetical protein JST30_08185 [Armatimonadetes bacterium]|nr:hypothetical protein [Armatimonadota bacterium]